jgi:hypothetical protein
VVIGGQGQALHARFLGQPFGHGPAFENAVLLQAEIEVQRAGLMPLDHESPCYLSEGEGPSAESHFDGGIGGRNLRSRNLQFLIRQLKQEAAASVVGWHRRRS